MYLGILPVSRFGQPPLDSWSEEPYAYCLSYAPGSQAWYVQLQQGLLQANHPSHPVLPLHLLFLAASLLVGLFLLWFDGRRSFDGQIALLYLVLHDGAKALLESFREPYVAQLQLTSLVISAAGLVLLLLILYRRRSIAGAGAS